MRWVPGVWITLWAGGCWIQPAEIEAKLDGQTADTAAQAPPDATSPEGAPSPGSASGAIRRKSSR